MTLNCSLYWFFHQLRGHWWWVTVEEVDRVSVIRFGPKWQDPLNTLLRMLWFWHNSWHDQLLFLTWHGNRRSILLGNEGPPSNLHFLKCCQRTQKPRDKGNWKYTEGCRARKIILVVAEIIGCASIPLWDSDLTWNVKRNAYIVLHLGNKLCVNIFFTFKKE